MRSRGRSRPEQLTADIAALEHCGRDQLIARWAQLYGTPAPARFGRDLLVRAIAHRLQEQALGRLKPALRRRLAAAAERLARQGDAAMAAGPPAIKPGTQLLRDWRGETHRVTVLDDGFAYRGRQFRSLSHIAREITGARWSGPLFFGLKRPSGAKAETPSKGGARAARSSRGDAATKGSSHGQAR